MRKYIIFYDTLNQTHILTKLTNFIKKTGIDAKLLQNKTCTFNTYEEAKKIALRMGDCIIDI